MHVNTIMDKKTFKEIVGNLAEIKDKGSSKIPTKVIVAEINDDGEVIEKEVEQLLPNPTLGFDLVKLKDNFKSCELGCGKQVNNQVIEKRFCETPEAHWRTRCKNCGLYKHPSGIGFIEGGGHAASAEYVKWFNYVNGYAKTKNIKPISVPVLNKEIQKKSAWISETGVSLQLADSANNLSNLEQEE